MTADSALMDVTVSKSGTQSPGTCSSLCQPTDPASPRGRAGTPSQGLARGQDPPPTPITNFCIEEILKPGFGRSGSKVKATRPSAFSPWASTGGGSGVGLANNNNVKNNNNKDVNNGSRLLHPALGVVVGKSVGSLAVPFDLSHGSGSAPAWIHRSGNPYPLPHSPSHSPTEPRSAAKDQPTDGKCDVRERCASFTTRCSSIPDLCTSIPDHGSSQDSGKDQCATRDVEPKKEGEVLWPAWVYCTRYSDRPSSGPRSRKIKRHDRHIEEKRPRTAFTNEQLSALKREFDENRYLTEERRQRLASELNLNESQIKIWFQNKRAKLKKASGQRNGLALQLMAQGLYNHSTIPVHEDDNSDDSKTS